MLITTLKKRTDFKRLTTSGKSIKSKSFILQYKPFPDAISHALESLRYGLTVTKKIGNAVIRNRVKRRLRPLIRDLFPTLALPFCDYVFIARHSLIDQHFDLLKKEVEISLEKIKKTVT
ncbi:MAG: ribonuclease P protein component [Alphaproteobacteria bacterium]|nr:ribonuclease P protein component [Alphaproteobacteria bacterium]